MERTLVVACLGLGVFAAPPVGAADTVEQWGLYEIELEGPTDGNPFLDVQLSAVFANGSRKVGVRGFYDGDGIYRVRFMPEQPGIWRYETQSNRGALARRTGSFTAAAPSGTNHGPARVRNTYHFAYADGTTFRPFGTTCYNWLQAPDEWQERTLETLATSPFNKLRMLVLPQDIDFLHDKTTADWDRLFQVLAESDPYDHLRSIHNGYLICDHNKPWVTHASVPNGSAVEDPGRAVLYRDVWRKPVVYDEVKYEGNLEARWGQLTPQEMVHRFWSGAVAGTDRLPEEDPRGRPRRRA